jgi:hypothetical protein
MKLLESELMKSGRVLMPTPSAPLLWEAGRTKVPLL